MSRSLDNDCTIQDLAFQVLNPFGANNFNIRPLARIMSFMTWPSKTWTQVNMIVKTWQPPQFWNLTFLLRLGNIPCLDMLHFLATPCPQVLAMIALDIQDLAFQVLKLFGAKNFNIWPLPRICLSWLGLPRRDHKWTWLSRLGSHRSEILHFSLLQFCNSMSSSLDKDCTIQDLAFQVLKLFAV